MLATQVISAHCIESLRVSGVRDGATAAASQDQLGKNKVGQNVDESSVSQRIRVKSRL